MLELSKNVTMHRAKLLQAAPNQCCIGMAYELRSAVCCEEFTDAYLHKVKLKTKKVSQWIKAEPVNEMEYSHSRSVYTTVQEMRKIHCFLISDECCI